jgi:hypothetical protein
VARPRLGTAPTAEQLAAVGCPVDRTAAISRFARTCGTLPSGLSRLRRAAIREAIAAGHTMTVIAARADLSIGRISQLAGQE